jgi:radical SAM superfamily enzyme YgiQ (UPF0313 family)
MGIKKIIVGGRWIIDSRPDLLQALLPDVDLVVDGLGEGKIAELVGFSGYHFSGYTPLNYELLDLRELYQPSIEVGRGCGMGCAFCQERDEKLQPLKDPCLLVGEVQRTILRDNLTPMTPYLEASMFKPNQAWIDEFSVQRELFNTDFKWRTESRVDTLNKKNIPSLAAAGLSVLDLGLESASHQQILAMDKSKKPENYLRKACDLLLMAKDFGIDVKVNILLYAGETNKTVNETHAWLDKYRDCIKGLSVGTVSAFGWNERKKSFIQSLLSAGASVSEHRLSKQKHR